MPDITFNFTGDISDLEAAVRDARAAVGDVKDSTESSSKATAKAADKAGDSAKKAGKSFESLGETAGETGSIMGALGGALGIVSPELGEAAGMAGSLAGGIEGVTKAGALLGSSTLPILAAALVAAGAAAYLMYEDFRISKLETEELGGSLHGLSLASADVEERHKAARDAAKAFAVSTMETAEDVAVLNGTMTEFERASRRSARAVNAEIAPALADASAKAEETQKNVENLTAELKELEEKGYAASTSAGKSLHTQGMAAEDLGNVQKANYEADLKAKRESIAAAQVEQAAAAETLKSLSARVQGEIALRGSILKADEAARAAAEAEMKNAKWLADQAAKKAKEAAEEAERIKKLAEAQAELDAAYADQLKRLDEIDKAFKNMADAQESATRAQMSDLELIDAQRKDALTNLKANYDAGLAAAEGNALEEWTIENCWPQTVNWGDLDYTSSDTADIEMTLRYDRAHMERKNTTTALSFVV